MKTETNGSLDAVPIYHLSLKPISRGAGRTSTAAAAYRSATKIVDERTGEVFDFSRKKGVVHSQIVMPPASDWRPSRAELWNTAEAAERRKDACLSREHEVALPKEMNNAQRLSLVQAYAQDLAQRHGCAVDFNIHSPRPDAKGGEENWHAHLMCTTRKAGLSGLGEKCDREKAGRDRKADLSFERQRWEQICNQHLKQAGIDQQIDCRSLAEQGILDRSAGQHLGPTAAAVDHKNRKGITNGKRNQQHLENPESGRRNPPPSRRGRLLPLSECPLVPVQGVGGAVLLSEDVQRRLERHRAEHDFGLRRTARRSENLKEEYQAELQRRAAARQAEAARAAESSARLRRRLTQEPARVWGGDGKESRYLSLDGLFAESRNGRTVWRFAKTNIAAVVDYGDSLSIPKLSDSRVGAAIEIAKGKGWKSLVLTGSDEFKEKACRAALEAGLRVENEEMQDLVREIERELQQAAQKLEQPTPQPPAAKAPQKLQGQSEKPEVGPPPLAASPAALGRRAAEVDYLLAEQVKAAERLRTMPGYAECTNKHAQASAALQEARNRQREGVKDDPWLREVFSANATQKLAERREQMQQQQKAAQAALEKLENEGLLKRFLSASERKRLAEKVDAAKKATQDTSAKIQKIEEACKAMADPQTRKAYRSWAIDKMAQQNRHAEELEKRCADLEAERQRLERKAEFDADEARRLTEERERIRKRLETLPPVDQERFNRARQGQTEEATAPPTPKQILGKKNTKGPSLS